MNDNRCVCCGRIIPECRQVCPICEAKAARKDNADYWFNEWIFPLGAFLLAVAAIVCMMNA